MRKKPIYRILSLDGGGIRGLITAVWLQRLEELLRSPLGKHFDLVIGTSIGSLIACGISAGIPLREIVELCVSRGHEIFPSPASRRWAHLTRLFSEGLSQPRYDGTGMEEVLRSTFGDRKFGQLKVKPTLVTSYDTFSRTPIIFKNTKPEHAGLPIWQVCKGSSSAPVYFPAHVMKLRGAMVPLIDGGVVANNPTACAIAEGVRLNSERSARKESACELKDFVVASFGTGQAIRPITPDEAKEWGALEWSFPLIDVLFDGPSDATDYVATQLIPEGQYFRFQVPLTKAYDDLDRADDANLNALRSLATQYIDTGEGQKLLTGLVKKLTSQQP